ncbi:MAG TPA: D-aminoacylase [Fimbriiglobus sp.]|jgi:N-acyl-D-amino-acid deacylase
MFDYLLRNGTVVDGSGTPGVAADVGVTGDRIAAVGRLAGAKAQQVIDATGLVVCPGFIDAHVHGDLPLLVDPVHEQAIRQGVTTYIVGQDGVAFAPGSPKTQSYMRRYTAGFNGNFPTPGKEWKSVDQYLSLFDRNCSLNVATLIPNGNVRMEVMGLDPRPATMEEWKIMRDWIREGMEQGAVGLSSGLDYIPSIYADGRELMELCMAIAPYEGIYVTHMRGYTPANAPAALKEVFAIGRGAGCGVHVSHFNCLAGQTIPILDEAIASGIDLTFDLYCYIYGSTIVAMLCLPPEMGQGGIDATLNRLRDPGVRLELLEAFANPRFPLETIRLASCPHPDFQRYEGMLLTEAVGPSGPTCGLDRMVEFVCDLLIATDLAAGCVIRHFAERQESDILKLMRHPAMTAGSDGVFVGGKPHPRGTGCFARYLGHHVRSGHWTLEEAVAKCSAKTADRFGLKHRGYVKEGFFADLAVFDPAKIEDRSTFLDGAALAVGMKHVFVNGEAVLLDGERTIARPGRGLRHNR